MTTPRRVTVRGIIFKDGHMLAQQLKPAEDGKERDYWCTPGGGLESGESLRDGLYREMIEETGIAPKIGKLLFIQQFAERNKEFLEFFFHIENPESYNEINLSTTSHGELEVNVVDFIVPAQHTLLPVFLQTIDIQGYINTDQPVFAISNLD